MKGELIMDIKRRQAFPRRHDEFEGMTLRDYFAGQVLVGYIARLGTDPDSVWDVDESGNEILASKELSFSSYKFADAMLKERGKE